MRDFVLQEVLGCLWHTTHPDRFKNILDEAAILPEPDIPNKDRWKTSKGVKFYPYVRSIGGVSLFDFMDFDKVEYEKRYTLSNWDTFVPYLQDWGCAVWIKINRDMIASNFVSGAQLVEKWNLDGAYQRTIMPEIEAAHIGPISIKTFERAFLVTKEKSTIEELTF